MKNEILVTAVAIIVLCMVCSFAVLQIWGPEGQYGLLAGMVLSFGCQSAGMSIRRRRKQENRADK